MSASENKAFTAREKLVNYFYSLICITEHYTVAAELDTKHEASDPKITPNYFTLLADLVNPMADKKSSISWGLCADMLRRSECRFLFKPYRFYRILQETSSTHEQIESARKELIKFANDDHDHDVMAIYFLLKWANSNTAFDIWCALFQKKPRSRAQFVAFVNSADANIASEPEHSERKDTVLVKFELHCACLVGNINAVRTLLTYSKAHFTVKEQLEHLTGEFHKENALDYAKSFTEDVDPLVVKNNPLVLCMYEAMADLYLAHHLTLTKEEKDLLSPAIDTALGKIEIYINDRRDFQPPQQQTKTLGFFVDYELKKRGITSSVELLAWSLETINKFPNNHPLYHRFCNNPGVPLRKNLESKGVSIAAPAIDKIDDLIQIAELLIAQRCQPLQERCQIQAAHYLHEAVRLAAEGSRKAAIPMGKLDELAASATQLPEISMLLGGLIIEDIVTVILPKPLAAWFKIQINNHPHFHDRHYLQFAYLHCILQADKVPHQDYQFAATQLQDLLANCTQPGNIEISTNFLSNLAGKDEKILGSKAAADINIQYGLTLQRNSGETKENKAAQPAFICFQKANRIAEQAGLTNLQNLALFYIGCAYCDGNGAQRDFSAAAKAFAATKDHHDARIALSGLICKPDKTGDISQIAINRYMADQWLATKPESTCFPACYYFITLYLSTGRAQHDKIQQHRQHAKKQLQKLADDGCTQAIYLSSYINNSHEPAKGTQVLEEGKDKRDNKRPLRNIIAELTTDVADILRTKEKDNVSAVDEQGQGVVRQCYARAPEKHWETHLPKVITSKAISVFNNPLAGASAPVHIRASSRSEAKGINSGSG